MPIVEIDGVGRVELDDGFLQMSPAQQEAPINEIAASARPQAKHSSPAPQQQAPDPAQMQPAPPMGEIPPAAPQPASPRPGGTNFDFDAMERDFQEQQRRERSQGGRTSAYPQADKTSTLGAAGLGAVDGLSFGFDDEIGSGLAAVIPGIGKRSIWDGSSLSDAFDANVKAYRGTKDAAFNEHPLAYLGGGVASAFLPWGAAGSLVSGGRGIIGAAKAAEALGTASNASRFTKAAKNGILAGAAYGAGSDTGGITDRLDGAATGAAIGGGLGLAGEAVIGGALRALPKAKAMRFAQREAERNPYAAYDAEVVADLEAATKDRAVTATDPKGRAALTAKTINSVEQRYFSEYKNIINSMDGLPDVDKLRLKAALTGKHSLPSGEIDALRGTVEGDAVADAIVKVQRLRALTPEIRRSNGLLAKVAGAVDFIPGVPPGVGNTIRKVGRAVGDGEAARVNAAEKLLAKKRGYAKLQEMVGPSGQVESNAALWQKVADQAEEKAGSSLDAQIEKVIEGTRKDVSKRFSVSKKDPDYINFRNRNFDPDAVAEARDIANRRRKLKSASGKLANDQDNKLAQFDEALNAAPPEPPAPKDPTKKELSDFRKSITDPTPDMRDLNDPVPTDRALASRVQNRNKALNKLESAQSDWEAKLADPSTAPQPKVVKLPRAGAKDAIVESNIEQGIVGESGTHNAFTQRVGVTKDDLMRILDQAQEDHPAIASELNRIRFNYPTKDRTFGSAIVPKLKAIRDKLGIEPVASEAKAAAEAAPVKIDEAAQERLAGATEAAAPKLTGKALAREQELLTRLDEIDPERISLGDGPAMRDSEAGVLTDPAKLEEASKIKDELRQLRQVDRPIQWTEGKGRYQALANGAIDDLNNDIRIDGASLAAIKRVPEKIRDSFKTTDEATAFIENEVIPELEVAKVPRDEIDQIKGYLYEIASHKPYATKEAYEAGTKANPRGRPRKQ